MLARKSVAQLVVHSVVTSVDVMVAGMAGVMADATVADLVDAMVAWMAAVLVSIQVA